jgi:hypothetical protein
MAAPLGTLQSKSINAGTTEPNTVRVAVDQFLDKMKSASEQQYLNTLRYAWGEKNFTDEELRGLAKYPDCLEEGIGEFAKQFPSNLQTTKKWEFVGKAREALAAKLNPRLESEYKEELEKHGTYDNKKAAALPFLKTKAGELQGQQATELSSATKAESLAAQVMPTLSRTSDAAKLIQAMFPQPGFELTFQALSIGAEYKGAHDAYVKEYPGRDDEFAALMLGKIEKRLPFGSTRGIHKSFSAILNNQELSFQQKKPILYGWAMSLCNDDTALHEDNPKPNAEPSKPLLKEHVALSGVEQKTQTFSARLDQAVAQAHETYAKALKAAPDLKDVLNTLSNKLVQGATTPATYLDAAGDELTTEIVKLSESCVSEFPGEEKTQRQFQDQIHKSLRDHTTRTFASALPFPLDAEFKKIRDEHKGDATAASKALSQWVTLAKTRQKAAKAAAQDIVQNATTQKNLSAVRAACYVWGLESLSDTDSFAKFYGLTKTKYAADFPGDNAKFVFNDAVQRECVSLLGGDPKDAYQKILGNQVSATKKEAIQSWGFQFSDWVVTHTTALPSGGRGITLGPDVIPAQAGEIRKLGDEQPIGWVRPVWTAPATPQAAAASTEKAGEADSMATELIALLKPHEVTKAVASAWALFDYSKYQVATLGRTHTFTTQFIAKKKLFQQSHGGEHKELTMALQKALLALLPPSHQPDYKTIVNGKREDVLNMLPSNLQEKYKAILNDDSVYHEVQQMAVATLLRKKT